MVVICNDSIKGGELMSKKTIDTIEALGKLQGKSLKDIGKESGVGENAIYRWKDHEPKISTLKRVAHCLHVDYKVLLP